MAKWLNGNCHFAPLPFPKESRKILRNLPIIGIQLRGTFGICRLALFTSSSYLVKLPLLFFLVTKEFFKCKKNFSFRPCGYFTIFCKLEVITNGASFC